jgi:hypothetical protein
MERHRVLYAVAPDQTTVGIRGEGCDHVLDPRPVQRRATPCADSIGQRKRQLAVYFAFFTITLLSKNSWSASLSHPAVQDRINAATALIGADRSELAEAIAHTSFAALRALWPTAPGVAVMHPGDAAAADLD